MYISEVPSHMRYMHVTNDSHPPSSPQNGLTCTKHMAAVEAKLWLHSDLPIPVL